jgi:methylase of polypeptide subunit release factors
VYRRLLAAAPKRLRARGALYLECGPRNARELCTLASQAFPSAHTEIQADLAGLDRIVRCSTGMSHER